MSKNYYEILEINKNASQEIVEKAYKTLAKKYHPDLQEGDKKTEYEEKLKVINEAYEILSDPERRKEYDATLPEQVSAEEYENLYRQKEYMKQRINRMEHQNDDVSGYEGFQNPQPNQYNSQYDNRQNADEAFRREQEALHRREEELKYQQQMNNAVNKAYHDAYINDLKRRGYRIKYKKTWKDYLAVLLTAVIVISVFVIAWQIPAVRNYFTKLYNENYIVHVIGNFFIILFRAFGSLFGGGK